MFQFPGFAFVPYGFRNKYFSQPTLMPTSTKPPGFERASHQRKLEVGFPIRKFTDQSLFAAPHDLSQRTTSFIASQRQGIHRILLRHLIALIVDARIHPSRNRIHRVPPVQANTRRRRRGRRHSAEPSSHKDQLLDHAREHRGQAGVHKTENADAVDTSKCWQVPTAKPDMVPLHDVDRSRTRSTVDVVPMRNCHLRTA